MTKTLKQIHNDLVKLVAVLQQHDEFLEEMRISNRLNNHQWTYPSDHETHLQFVNTIEHYMSALSYLDTATEEWLAACPVPNPEITPIEVRHFTKLINQIQYRINQGYGDKTFESLSPVLN
jgi:hypothetical protein